MALSTLSLEWPYPSAYIRGKVLGGRGVTYTVYLRRYKYEDFEESKAIKYVPHSQADNLFEEERILGLVRWLYVVQCHGAELARDEFDLNRWNHHLILEYVSGGNLKELFQRNNPRGLRVFHVREIAKDILKGLESIYGRDVVHCDINPTNILLRPTDYGWRHVRYMFTIADFGSANDGESEGLYGHRLAHKSRDKRYEALELIRFGKIDSVGDIWLSDAHVSLVVLR